MRTNMLGGSLCLIALLFLFSPVCSTAQRQPRFQTDSHAQQEAVAQALKQNSYSLSLQEGVLRGPGLDFLAKRSANAQFVLFGEEHYVKEFPQFLSAFFLRSCTKNAASTTWLWRAIQFPRM